MVLKPNLVTFYQDDGENTADPTVNGVSTDWRVVKAVADLVRARNPEREDPGHGRLDGLHARRLSCPRIHRGQLWRVRRRVRRAGRRPSCDDASTSGLVQRRGRSGKAYWVNSRYARRRRRHRHSNDGDRRLGGHRRRGREPGPSAPRRRASTRAVPTRSTAPARRSIAPVRRSRATSFATITASGPPTSS